MSPRDLAIALLACQPWIPPDVIRVNINARDLFPIYHDHINAFLRCPDVVADYADFAFS
jgi:hypothetical protein